MTARQPVRGTVLAMAFLVAAFAGTVSARPEDGIPLRGRVTLPDGLPASGAKLHALAFDRAVPVAEWRSVADADGRFESGPLFPRSAVGCLTVDAPGCAVRVVAFGRRSHGGDGTHAVDAVADIRLHADAPVAGRVVDEAGRGVAGARVATVGFQPFTYSRFPSGDVAPETWPELGAVSDAAGRFALRRVDGSVGTPTAVSHVSVVADTPGVRPWRTGAAVVAHLPWDGPHASTNPVVMLRPAYAVSGRVVDVDTGTAVPGATVTAHGTGVFRVAPATTDADGRFRIRDVPAQSRLRIGVEHAGHAPAEVFRPAQRHELPDATTAEDVDIRLGRWTRVSGRIVDATAGGPTVVPVDLTARGEREAGSGFVQHTASGPADELRRVPGGDEFGITVATGPTVFRVEARPSVVGQRKPYAGSFGIGVPAAGIANRTLSVLREPGVLVAMAAADPARLARVDNGGDLLVWVREAGDGGSGLADGTPLWFFPVAAWGRTAEIRLLRRKPLPDGGADDIEVMPWTPFKADSTAWPLTLRVP